MASQDKQNNNFFSKIQQWKCLEECGDVDCVDTNNSNNRTKLKNFKKFHIFAFTSCKLYFPLFYFQDPHNGTELAYANSRIKL